MSNELTVASRKYAIERVVSTPKKHAKEAAKKHTKKDAGPGHKEPGKDELRAYSHLGRIAVIRPLMKDNGMAIVVDHLLAFAREEAKGPEHAKALAEVLRAAEHMVFAALEMGTEHPTKLRPKLENAIDAEFARLFMKATEGTVLHSSLDELKDKIIQSAKSAYTARQFCPALELIRAAESFT